MSGEGVPNFRVRPDLFEPVKVERTRKAFVVARPGLSRTPLTSERPPVADFNAGDVLDITRAASIQFIRPITFRLVRVLDWPTYDGWAWLDGYEMGPKGDAVTRRTIFVQPAELRRLSAGHTSRARAPPSCTPRLSRADGAALTCGKWSRYMQVTEALDAIAALIRASEHPDITAVTRYGGDTRPGGQSPPGVKVIYRSGSSALLWAADEPHPVPAAEPLPAEMPPPTQRATRMLVFATQLLDYARPPIFKNWETCGFPGVHLSPSALRITCADGTTVYLRVTVASGPGREPEADPHPDYRIPEGVREWPLKVSAPSAARE